MKYCLAIKLTWVLFHYICALKDESEKLFNDSSNGLKKTTKILVNSPIHESNVHTLEYVSVLVYVTPQSNLTKSNVTVNSKEMLTSKLSNSTEQLAKSLSLETTANKPITPEPYFQEETDAEIDNLEKPELSKSSAHSGDSHTDPEENPEDDFEDIESQIDEENRLLNGKDFTESESKESIHQSDRNNVVHDESHIFKIDDNISLYYIFWKICGERLKNKDVHLLYDLICVYIIFIVAVYQVPVLIDMMLAVKWPFYI
ncbi:unnamed protein product [Schistosoma turkestanicum]|nr:unnamed protein product [Schistosoma turkestanicum]